MTFQFQILPPPPPGLRHLSLTRRVNKYLCETWHMSHLQWLASLCFLPQFIAWGQIRLMDFIMTWTYLHFLCTEQSFQMPFVPEWVQDKCRPELWLLSQGLPLCVMLQAVHLSSVQAKRRGTQSHANGQIKSAFFWNQILQISGNWSTHSFET